MTFWEVDVLGLDILGVDILGVDILRLYTRMLMRLLSTTGKYFQYRIQPIEKRRKLAVTPSKSFLPQKVNKIVPHLLLLIHWLRSIWPHKFSLSIH